VLFRSFLAEKLMGNTSQSLPDIFQNYEHRQGTKLLAAIREDSKEGIDEAVEFARQECIKAKTSTSTSASNDFDLMIDKMTTYLTQQYDVGDGPIFTKTPIELAKDLYCDHATPAIEDHLSKLKMQTEKRNDGKSQRSMFTSKDKVGESKQKEVAAAKARLLAFREKGTEKDKINS